MKRRDFIKLSAVLLGSTAFAESTKNYALHISIVKEPFVTLMRVQEDLFPPNLSMPSLHQINVLGFLKAVLEDSKIKTSTKKQLLDGVKWLNQTTQNSYSKNYISLPYKTREKLLKEISQKEWGNNWLWYIMNFTFEAMFSDPIYGGNLNGNGWKWIDHVSGLPRPPRVNANV
jgi:gluconate 2-dehydrogenase gamma chain